MKQIFLIILGVSLALHADFSKTGDTVTDNIIGLQWQDDGIGSIMTWTSAITHCENLSLDGHSDWRLPNLNELTSIVDDSKVNPAIDDSATAFEHIASSYYWSSTTYAGNASSAWIVNFYGGYQGNDDKDDNYYVCCVRAGQ